MGKIIVSDEQKKQMQELADSGKTAQQISKIMNVGIATVRVHCDPKISEEERWRADFTRRWNETVKLFK